MVVRNRRTGEWMMPGGRAERGESPVRTALREVWEETGGRVRGDVTHVYARDGVHLFDAPGQVSRSTSRRRADFGARPAKGETDDYGFVDLHGPGFVVTDYAGRPKAPGAAGRQAFRKGTIEHLNALRRR